MKRCEPEDGGEMLISLLGLSQHEDSFVQSRRLSFNLSRHDEKKETGVSGAEILTGPFLQVSSLISDHVSHCNTYL